MDVFLVLLLSFIYYCVQLPPGITFEDAGYFLATSLEGGYAHPPGYPLYTLLLKVWTSALLIFTSNAAYLGALLSALLTSVGISLFYSFLKSYVSSETFTSTKVKTLILGLFSLLLMTSFELVEQTVLIEVYALHFILLALLFISLQRKAYLFTGLITGLALSNHSTAIYFFAFVLLWLVLIDKIKFKVVLVEGVKKFVPGVILGLLPYLYLPLIANPMSPLQWGSANTWQGFKEIVFRTNYWKVPASEFSTQVAQLKVAGMHFFDQWGYLIPLLFLATFAIYFLTKKLNRHLLYWHLCWFIQLPLMALLANMTVENEGTKLVSVFFIPAYLFTVIALLVAYQFIKNKKIIAQKSLEMGTLVFLTVSLLFSSVMSYQKASMSKYTTPQVYTNQVKSTVKDNKAILLTWNDFAFTPIVYEKYVRKQFNTLIPIPNTFFKDYNMTLKYEKMHNLNVEPLKKATLTFLKNRTTGFIGTIDDETFYDTLSENISVWLRQGYKVYTEYKITSKKSSLYYNPMGPFFEVLTSKPLLESEFIFLEQEKPNYPLGNNDLWHKQFYAKYSEQLILRALLNRSSKNRDRYLNQAKVFSKGTLSETKVFEGIKKHFPDFE